MSKLVKQMINEMISGDEISAGYTLNKIIAQKVKHLTLKESTSFSVDGLQHALRPSEYNQHKKDIASMFPGVSVSFSGDEMTYTGPKDQVKKAVIHHYDGDRSEAVSLHPILKESTSLDESIVAIKWSEDAEDRENDSNQIQYIAYDKRNENYYLSNSKNDAYVFPEKTDASKWIVDAKSKKGYDSYNFNGGKLLVLKESTSLDESIVAIKWSEDAEDRENDSNEIQYIAYDKRNKNYYLSNSKNDAYVFPEKTDASKWIVDAKSKKGYDSYNFNGGKLLVLKESTSLDESTAFHNFAKPNHLIVSANQIEDPIEKATTQYVFKQIKGEDKSLKVYKVDQQEDRTYKKLLRQLNLKQANLSKPFLMNAGYEFKLVKSEAQTFYSAEHKVVIVLNEENVVIYFSAVSDDKE